MKRKWLILAALAATHFVASTFGVVMLFAVGGAALGGIDVEREMPLWWGIYLGLLLPVLELPFGWLALVYSANLAIIAGILFFNSLSAICIGWLIYYCVLRIRDSYARNKSAA